MNQTQQQQNQTRTADTRPLALLTALLMLLVAWLASVQPVAAETTETLFHPVYKGTVCVESIGVSLYGAEVVFDADTFAVITIVNDGGEYPFAGHITTEIGVSACYAHDYWQMLVENGLPELFQEACNLRGKCTLLEGAYNGESFVVTYRDYIVEPIRPHIPATRNLPESARQVPAPRSIQSFVPAPR